MKQTAVDWFWLNLTDDLIGDLAPEKILKIYELKEKAKAMEKEQIINAYNEGQNTPYEYSEDNEVNWYDGNNYYNETFKSE